MLTTDVRNWHGIDVYDLAELSNERLERFFTHGFRLVRHRTSIVKKNTYI